MKIIYGFINVVFGIFRVVENMVKKVKVIKDVKKGITKLDLLTF